MELINAGAIPTSSQPAIGDLIEVFEGTSEEILALFIGDGLSGGYQNAVGAKNSVEENTHIRIIDTKTLAGAERYLVQKAKYLCDEGMALIGGYSFSIFLLPLIVFSIGSLYSCDHRKTS